MTLFFRLLRFVIPYWKRAAIAVTLGFITIAANVGLMGTSGYLIAKAALRPDTDLLLWVPIVGVRFFGLSRGVFRYLERLASHDVTFRILARLRVWIYGELEPKAVKLLQSKRSADILGSLISDVEQLQYFYLRVLAPPVIAVLTAILGFVILWHYGIGLGLILLLMMAIGGTVIPYMSYRLARVHGARDTALRADLYVQAGDLLAGMQELTVNGRLAESVTRLFELQTEMDEGRKATNKIAAGTGAIMLGVVNVTMWFILVYSVYLVAGGQLAGWAIPVTVLVTLACFEAIMPLPLAFQNMEQTRVAANRFFHQADEIHDSLRVDPEYVEGCLPRDASIQIHELAVGYDHKSNNVIHNLNLAVAAGEHVAIIGESGAGKSTLLQVLAAMVPYHEGSVQLGGIELHRLSESVVREWIAFVPQDPYFFHASIEQNLRLAKPDATAEELQRALSLAQLDELLASLPEGMQTLVGEYGMRFSGGERQRFALARAILRDASIVLLDEPTTGLDARTKQAFWTAMDTVLKGKTVLWITHDLDELSKVDRVVKIHRGQVLMN